MAIDCQSVANEELKRLRNIERLLKGLLFMLSSQEYIDSLGLEV